MAKRIVDKEQYFTTPALAKQCVDMVSALYSLPSFGLIVEPSAGDGTFLSLLPSKTSVGIDLDPPMHMIDTLIKSDFLVWKPDTAQGRILTVGNPPFGARGSLAIKFINHAAQFSDVIAFIVPRSFNKYTFQNRIPDYFHLVDSVDCDDFYTPDGTPVKIKTVFQIWEKRDVKREKINPITTHNDFDMKHAHISRISLNELEALRQEYPFTIPQVGANFTPRDSASITQGSHWFIKPYTDKVKSAFMQANYDFLKDMNIAHTSLSKSDIIKAYEESVALNS